ncbi:Hypothetical predicted protein [Pelobates cultripes]|uniref:Uncharacterized protein n=1 Tax=Pelobates cultripes TaxID=61616 RepID=A0AAD1W2E6_PELCU|nr:Hypothetical predicted protein [Pelobates cultripes]
MEEQHSRDHTLDTDKTLLTLQTELTTTLNLHAKKKTNFKKHTYYTWGGGGKLLAQALRQGKQSTFIEGIRLQNGKYTQLMPEILKAFTEYYTGLYNLRESPPNPSEIQNFLRGRIKRTLPAN